MTLTVDKEHVTRYIISYDELEDSHSASQYMDKLFGIGKWKLVRDGPARGNHDTESTIQVLVAEVSKQPTRR